MINKVFSWIGALFDARTYTLHNFSVFLLVLMCIQYIPIESRAGVSWVKVVTMTLSVVVLLRYIAANKALVFAFFYVICLFFCSYLINYESFRTSTLIYRCMFVFSFVAFYTFVWNQHVFGISYFISFLKIFIFVLVGVLVVQQVFLLAGFKLVPIINLCQVLDRGIGANSLTFEPSTLGRVLNVLYYAYLKCNEYRIGRPIRVTEIFKGEHRWVTVAFLWAMLTMGSGTAFIAMAVTALYFMRGWYILLAVPMFVGVYFSLEYFGNESFERAINAADATLTGDTKIVRETDRSASSRINPMLNTINNLDLSKSETWFGHGVDYAVTHKSEKMIGDITDYGLIAYILSLVLVFSCSIDFFSLATLMFFLGVGGGTGNIAYGWGILMIFTCVKYFRIDSERYWKQVRAGNRALN